MDERTWRRGCLYGVNREILDPCIQYPRTKRPKTDSDKSKIRQSGKGTKNRFP